MLHKLRGHHFNFNLSQKDMFNNTCIESRFYHPTRIFSEAAGNPLYCHGPAFVFMRYTGIYSPRTGTTTGFKILNNLSGKRDSNPQPSPWQGDILPIELLPHWGEQELNLVHLFLLFNSKMERMMRVELTSRHWQCHVITVILHPHGAGRTTWRASPQPCMLNNL